MKDRYRFGLLGHNVGYSKSHEIFSIIARMRNIGIDFETMDCAAEELSTALDTLTGFDGFSVTIPYKTAVLSRMEQISESARKIGAVNSVSVRDGRMQGFNTDIIGFAAPLRRLGFSGTRALILGTGGAARAVGYALATSFGMTDITVCSRTSAKSSELARYLTSALELQNDIHATTYERLASDAGYDLIVNCTPVGGRGMPDRSPLPDAFGFAGQPLCYDLAYEPEKTKFLRHAREMGCQAMGGISMLVRQAIESYTIWTRDQIDRDAMSRAVFSELKTESEG